jgi:iron(III) transport system ATP-binding protein
MTNDLSNDPSHLELVDVHKGYGDQPVLTGLDLAVPPESITAILGPSGSGKTTLLRLVAGFDRIDRGKIRIGTTTVDDGRRCEPPERRRLGYVPQEGALFPHLTVAANVAFGLAHRRRQQARVAELLDQVGLGGLERRYPDQLSGGQQQRVALARALAVEPTLVLLDEPFSALDASLRATIRSEVRDILRRAGATAVLVTHDQDEALSLADQVAVLRGGRVVQHGPPHQVYADPVDPELARFLGEANVLDAQLSAGRATTVLGSLRVVGTPRSLAGSDSGGAAGRRSGQVMIRPEQVQLVPGGDPGDDPGDGAAGGSAAAGTVVGSDFHGHYTLVRIRLDHPPEVDPGLEILARHEGQAPLVPGTHVRLAVRGDVAAWTD